MDRRRLGDERIGHVGAQGYDERPHRLWKAQVELKRVVHWMEVARRNEVEILSLRIPGRRAVRPQRRGRIVDPTVGEVGDPDD